MVRFIPAAVLSLCLWAAFIQGLLMMATSVNRYFDSVGGLFSISWLF